jgi:3-oxoacyl-[acyl-carrier protein] reductase
MNLKDKKAIVTGGVKGIGKAIVSNLLNEGVIVGVFDIDVTGFDDLQQNNTNVCCIECDVTSPVKVKSAVDRFYNEFGEINVLVNNAGILFSAPLVRLTAQGIIKHDVNMWEKVIATDLSSVFYMTTHVSEKMILKRTKGVIVNISSISAAGNAGQSAYSAAKAGVNALTVTWSKELGLLGIRVIGIAPGFFDTESTHKALSDDHIKHVVKEVPLRRLGKTDEIAHCITSILQNDYINGKIIEIDGGLTI